MKVNILKPEIIRFAFRQEKGDPNYGSCLWANFDFDTVNYNLSIASDCGYYGYGWTVTPSEPFLKLMARIHDDYLLRKMCRESVVDWDATKEGIIEALREDDSLIEEEVEDAIEELEALADDYDVTESPEYTTALLEKWNDENCRINDLWDYVRTDYMGDEKKIAQVFEDHIKPAIREYLKEHDNE